MSSKKKVNKKSRKFLNSRFYIIVGLILLFSVIIFAAVPNNGHNASVVCIKIDGTERTLQYAVENNLFAGTHTYATCASAPLGGHNADKIWLSVNGVEMTLTNAASTSGLVGSSSVPYAQSLNPGHLASEIVVVVDGQETTLQQSVNTGELACTPTSCSTLGCGSHTASKDTCWATIDCGTCGPTCGANGCESGETCSSCPADCGSCQTTYTNPRIYDYYMRDGLAEAQQFCVEQGMSYVTYSGGTSEVFAGEVYYRTWTGVWSAVACFPWSACPIVTSVTCTR